MENHTQTPQPRPFLRTLLTALNRYNSDLTNAGWFWEPEHYAKGMNEFLEDLKNVHFDEAIDNFLRLIGFLVAEIERPDLAQGLIDDLEPRVTEEHFVQISAAIAREHDNRMDEVLKKKDLLNGASATQAEIPQPTEKIDFKIPKGSVKG